jgi:hypothetical protein
MDLTEREKRVRTFVEEVWNKRNYEAAHDLYADTYVNGFGTGSAARVEPIRRYHQAFPDSKVPRHRPGVRGLSTFRIALALWGWHSPSATTWPTSAPSQATAALRVDRRVVHLEVVVER